MQDKTLGAKIAFPSVIQCHVEGIVLNETVAQLVKNIEKCKVKFGEIRVNLRKKAENNPQQNGGKSEKM